MVLLDCLAELHGLLEAITCKESRAAFRGLQFGSMAKRFSSRGGVAIHQQQTQVQVRGRHLRVQRNRAQELSLGILGALQSYKRVAELKMCVGIVGALRNVFLERVERRGE